MIYRWLCCVCTVQGWCPSKVDTNLHNKMFKINSKLPDSHLLILQLWTRGNLCWHLVTHRTHYTLHWLHHHTLYWLHQNTFLVHWYLLVVAGLLDYDWETLVKHGSAPLITPHLTTSKISLSQSNPVKSYFMQLCLIYLNHAKSKILFFIFLMHDQ